ncbi:hypothetical protein CEXT_307231 [Caerostris extrusa]|uniref:Uncharacterized protein n=1 Tax=Caerostris extrusa TaxID=172846 RepID=A0AAV4TSY9_CAEEX|nr:hypothetical protein CEXT_307231 [Caerostris extrusa]
MKENKPPLDLLYLESKQHLQLNPPERCPQPTTRDMASYKSNRMYPINLEFQALFHCCLTLGDLFLHCSTCVHV